MEQNDLHIVSVCIHKYIHANIKYNASASTIKQFDLVSKWNITWPYAMKSRGQWSWSAPYCTWRGGTLPARRAATPTWRSAEDSFHKNKNNLRNLFRPQTWILQLQLYSSEQCSTTTCQYQLPYCIDITYTYSYVWYVMTCVLQKPYGYSTRF